ncbi:uncharacterized protein J3D65DRAFT_605970 [Phyllosticta citribraziliensis]|uniref:Uncharacterized protein n=1 Tax=Phyllosticta citribraziliensis TaxID=989973 RepID=A0ABR1LC06_9PEZI
MFSTRPSSLQHENGAAINLARGRAAEFIDRPLEEGEELDRAAMGAIDEDFDDDATELQYEDSDDDAIYYDYDHFGPSDPHVRSMSAMKFIKLLWKRIVELPGRSTWPDLVRTQCHAVFFLVVAKGACEHDDLIASWYNRWYRDLEHYRNNIVIQGIPDRDVNMLELADRIYYDTVREVDSLSMEDGNPFSSGRAVQLLEVYSLLFSARFLRRVARIDPSRNMAFAGFQTAVMRRAVDLGGELAEPILLQM